MSTRAVKPRLAWNRAIIGSTRFQCATARSRGHHVRTAQEHLDLQGRQIRTRRSARLPGTIVLRRYVDGEEICGEDDPGYTAFYVLTAKEVADLNLPPLKTKGEADRAVSVTRRQSKDAVFMGEGELFGEMSCIYRIPRFGDGACRTRMLRARVPAQNVLDKINTGSFRNQLDDVYRKRFLSCVFAISSCFAISPTQTMHAFAKASNCGRCCPAS